MPQHRSKKILIYFFLFLLVGTLNNKSFINLSINKNVKIVVTGLDEKNNLELVKNLDLLKIRDLFFINKLQIKEIVNSSNLVEKFSVFKIYPSTLNIKIHKTELLAQVKIEGENYFLGSNGKLIKSKQFKKDIPQIFGAFKNESFFKLKKAIDESNFDYSEIENMFFFKSGRWDIETNSGLLIKLPKNDIIKSLNLSLNVLNKDDHKKIHMIDLRQSNQIIINGN